MKGMRYAAAALVLGLFIVTAGPAAQETNTSERTFLTFSSAVEMPGVTLPAGKYVFKLADTPSRNVVQAWNEKEDKMLGQWTFAQAERPEPSDENVIMFKEIAAGTTPTVQYWYFPGEKVGKEFIYPKDQAQRIAKRTGQPVLTGEGAVDADGKVTKRDGKQK
jgi:hypothetical protein